MTLPGPSPQSSSRSTRSEERAARDSTEYRNTHGSERRNVHPQIDFVAHDDIPYTSGGSEDVYKHIKEAGEAHSPALGNRI